MILSFTWTNCWVRLHRKIPHENANVVWIQMYYVMGLNVKEVLVILKCPKRGAFLLFREKLQHKKTTRIKQVKVCWLYGTCHCTKIHPSQSIPLFYHHWREGRHQQEWNQQTFWASQLWRLLQCWWWRLCHFRANFHLRILFFKTDNKTFLAPGSCVTVNFCFCWQQIHIFGIIRRENALTPKLKWIWWRHLHGFSSWSFATREVKISGAQWFSYRKTWNKMVHLAWSCNSHLFRQFKDCN